MPGLADMHVHMRMNSQALFNLFIANGVTTVRSMRLADGDVDHVETRSKVAAGLITGPRYLVCGPMLTPQNLSDINQVIPMLERHVEQGYDFVKIHEDLNPIIYDTLIREASARGLKVTGHAQHGLPLSESLRMKSIEHLEEILYVSRVGFGATDSIEDFLSHYKTHLAKLENPAFRMAIVNDVKASGVTIVPTLVIYDYLHQYLSDEQFEQLKSDPNLRYLPKATHESYLSASNSYRLELPQIFTPVLEKETIDQHFQKNVALLSKLLLEMHQAGVPFISGADAFGAVVPGFSLHQEFELMVAAGLSPYDVLKTSTTNVADYLGDKANPGSIAVGNVADFIMIDANPLADIRNARQVSGVFTQGKWHDKIALNQMLLEAERISQIDNSN
jgi:imidazolonepropionase-like amidohydrolase